MSDSEAKISNEFLSVPSHMKSRGWQLGMLFSVPAFVLAAIALRFLPEWQALILLMITLFFPFFAAHTAYRLGTRDASDDGRDG